MPRRRFRFRKLLLLVPLPVCILLLALAYQGCGDPLETGFGSSELDPDLLQGRWSGRWKSDGIHGSGVLRAGIRKEEDGTYRATFVAKYMGGLLTHVSEDVPLTVTDRDGDMWSFHGSKDLGMMSGGVYTYDGYVKGSRFYAKYDSSYDTGEFAMVRSSVSDSSAAGENDAEPSDQDE